MRYLKYINEAIDKSSHSIGYESDIIDFFVGMRGIDDLIECVINGMSGGIHRYSEEANGGKFEKEFLKKFIKINQGDNDFDYDIGRLGYKFLTSDNGLKLLSKHYLKEIETINIDDPYIDWKTIKQNCIGSLNKIIIS